MTNVVLGDNVVVVSENAFKNCTGLEEITISSTVYMVGANAFAGCSNLSTVNVSGAEFDIYNSVIDVEYGEPTDTVSVTDAEFLTKLTSTYVSKLWFRLPIA